MVYVTFAVLEVTFWALTTAVKLPRKFLTLIIINGDDGCSFWQAIQADSQPKSGLVLGRRPLGAILHSSNEPGELSQWLCHDDSTINIVVVIIIIIIIIIIIRLLLICSRCRERRLNKCSSQKQVPLYSQSQISSFWLGCFFNTLNEASCVYSTARDQQNYSSSGFLNTWLPTTVVTVKKWLASISSWQIDNAISRRQDFTLVGLQLFKTDAMTIHYCCI